MADVHAIGVISMNFECNLRIGFVEGRKAYALHCDDVHLNMIE